VSFRWCAFFRRFDRALVFPLTLESKSASPLHSLFIKKVLKWICLNVLYMRPRRGYQGRRRPTDSMRCSALLRDQPGFRCGFLEKMVTFHISMVLQMTVTD